MTQSFFIPIKPASWNRIATAHWRVYKQYKDLLAEATWVAVKQANIQPFKPGLVAIEVEARWKTKHAHDVDNLYIKACLDQLVKMGILSGDDCSVVDRVTLRGKNGSKEEGLLLTISSLD